MKYKTKKNISRACNLDFNEVKESETFIKLYINFLDGNEKLSNRNMKRNKVLEILLPFINKNAFECHLAATTKWCQLTSKQ